VRLGGVLLSDLPLAEVRRREEGPVVAAVYLNRLRTPTDVAVPRPAPRGPSWWALRIAGVAAVAAAANANANAARIPHRAAKYRQATVKLLLRNKLSRNKPPYPQPLRRSLLPRQNRNLPSMSPTPKAGRRP